MSAYTLPTDGQDPVGFALSYPFARPAGSFIFDPASGSATPTGEVRLASLRTGLLDGLEVPLAATEVHDGRRLCEAVPVLASGSNAAPSQLARKYRDMADLPPILAHEVAVDGIAAVYSAHVAGYGSIAATLHACPGLVSRLHLLFVPPAGFARLNATESLGGNYLLACLESCRLRVGEGEIVPLAYISRRGPVRVDGAPRRLPATAHNGAGRAEASQREMHAHLQRLMGEAGELEDFIARLVADAAFRAAATARLARDTSRTLPPGARVLAGA